MPGKGLKRKAYVREGYGWVVATILSAVIFFIVLYYHYLRRGILNPFLPNDISLLFLSNKAFAIGAMFLMGISFIIGPLARFFPSLRKKIEYRKQIGLMGFFFALIHIIVSYFFLSDKFPISWFIENQASVIFGVIGIIVLIIVAIDSMNAVARRIGHKKWIFIQRLAYIAFILAAAHIIALGKVPGWIRWMGTLEPIYPPGTLITILFVAAALVIRSIVIFYRKKKKVKKL